MTSISTAPRQGSGGTKRPPYPPVDPRLFVVAGLAVVLVALLLACTLVTYYEVETNNEKIGSMSLWRIDFKREVLEVTGTQLEDDPATRKAVVIHHTANNKHHRTINEDIIRGYQYCVGDAKNTCDRLRSLTRLFLSSQGKLLPSLSMTFASLLVIPLKTMRTTNQALVLTVVFSIVFVLLLALTANLGANLEDMTEDFLTAAFPDITVKHRWQAGSILLFIATGVAGLLTVGSLFLCLATRNHPYHPGDGPNYDQNNPMPPHFLPQNKRHTRVKEGASQTDPVIAPEPISDEQPNGAHRNENVPY